MITSTLSYPTYQRTIRGRPLSGPTFLDYSAALRSRVRHHFRQIISPDYVPESDHEADPEEDDDEDPKEDPIDYPADGGDDGDDEMDIEEDEGNDMDIDTDEEDEDDEMDVEVDEEDVADGAGRVIVSAATPPPHPAYRDDSARIPIQCHYLYQSWSCFESRGGLDLRLTTTRQRLGLALVPRIRGGESSACLLLGPVEVLRWQKIYGFVAIWQVRLGMTSRVLGWFMGSRSHVDEIVKTLQGLQAVSVILAGRVNMLFRDRRGHAHTRLLMETEARMSREAWVRSMDASNLARAEVMSLRTTVHAQMLEITELQSTDHNRRRAILDLLETDRGRREEMRELRAADRTQQQQIIQTLTIMQTLQREMIPLQGLVPHCWGKVSVYREQVMALHGGYGSGIAGGPMGAPA
ncbi:hypothetical protein Tco_0411793 [Tanacetum coccineum]